MKIRTLLMLGAIFLSLSAFSQQEARILRFPAIHGDQVVFTYAGNLYTVNHDGGLARRLTNDEGFEMFARFSPDGETIAFTGQYDGNTEVYTMPAEGGIPQRLTYTATLGRDDVADRMGPNNIVMSWTPDGDEIVYRSRKQTFNSFVGHLFKVNKEGGLSEELPFATGSWISYSPDGKKIAFNRVMREFRTWKYYEGGMADDIWIYDEKTHDVKNVTNHKAQDIFPMWHGKTVYFCSDRDRTMNIFAYDTESGDIRKVTNYTEYDVKFPSIGDNAIVYENGGYIHILDLTTEETGKISVTIADDFLDSRTELKDASKSIASYDISPDGKRVTFGARGDIFTVPAESGITRNLTESSGAHDRYVAWSPDGKYIAYLSDKDGEFEIYIQNQDGSEPAKKITKNSKSYIFGLEWSPDSKKILYSDKLMQLMYVDIESGKTTLIERNPYWEMNDYTWSPDSKWIAYSASTGNDFSMVKLYNLETKNTTEVTDMWYSSSSPSFSNDGKYLFFSSNRDYNPLYSRTEWNHAVSDMGKIYFIPLAKETCNPLAPTNDEVDIKEDKEDKSEDKKEDKKEEAKEEDDSIVIDLDGLSDRIIGLPVSVANYWNINCLDGKVYYGKYSSDTKKMTLNMYSLEDQKETELGENMGYIISANGKKMLISSRGQYYVTGVPSGKINLSESVDVSNMQMIVNYREEWNQIYDEAWRQMRDFFYDPDMHGVNWEKMHDKYAVMLPYVNTRNDLTYLIGELIGELSVGHAYINGGDRTQPDRIKMGLLGAKISRDKSGYYVIDELLDGENWRSNLRSPLTEVGVNAKEGEFILKVNGKSTKEMDDIFESLINTAGKQVILTLGASADDKDARDVIVKPVDDESDLYYYNWVQENIRKVNEATDGQVGYIHIPDMGPGGLVEFIKYFYPQLNKKALIIDDRGNGGGNVSPMIIERLRREITRANMLRNKLEPSQTPTKMLNGPMVLLINQYSASDGDLFPYSFKKHKLGKVIGVRSWGGVVGIRGSLPFIDGADMRKPEFASYGANGEGWIIEGWGVEPDIEIVNDPYKEYMGTDEQLDKAIEVILEELKDWKPLPSIPDGPDKSK